MIHEVKVQYRKMDDDGNERVHKEWYAIENQASFTEVEARFIKAFDYDNYKDFEVTDIKRSKVRELANTRELNADKVFMAEVKDIFLKDDGTEKDIKYKILFFAGNFDKAKDFICEYLEQGYNMTLITLKETKFIDVL